MMIEWPTPRVDGEPAGQVPVDDRGLAYGDGLFETILLYRGRPVWWQPHLQRLAAGAAALGIPAPADECWQHDLAELLLGCAAPLPERLVAKLMLTRGSSDRGYSAAAAGPRRLTRLLAAPAPDPGAGRDGIVVRWCGLRLGRQPRLAGYKHLNRLEQVLARAEWSDPDVHEGLLLDDAGAVVSAVAGNLFVARGGELLTPVIDCAGVAGICRRVLLESFSPAREQRLAMADVETADELFICNSVRGILPVRRLGERDRPIGPLTRAAQAHLAAADPAFSC